jgi:hypothetical protein
LTELWSKNQFLEAIFKTAAILKRSKNQLGLKLQLLQGLKKIEDVQF